MADRMEREIEDILRKVEDLESHRARRRMQPPQRPPSQRRPTSFSFGPQMLSFVVLAGIIAAVVFIERGGYAQGLMLFAVITGLVIFAAYLVREVGRHGAAGSGRPGSQHYWRGEPIDLRRPSPKRSFWDRFKRK